MDAQFVQWEALVDSGCIVGILLYPYRGKFLNVAAALYNIKDRQMIKKNLPYNCPLCKAEFSNAARHKAWHRAEGQSIEHGDPGRKPAGETRQCGKCNKFISAKNYKRHEENHLKK
jgi:hypothetical protein